MPDWLDAVTAGKRHSVELSSKPSCTRNGPVLDEIRRIRERPRKVQTGVVNIGIYNIVVANAVFTTPRHGSRIDRPRLSQIRCFRHRGTDLKPPYTRNGRLLDEIHTAYVVPHLHLQHIICLFGGAPRHCPLTSTAFHGHVHGVPRTTADTPRATADFLRASTGIPRASMGCRVASSGTPWRPVALAMSTSTAISTAIPTAATTAKQQLPTETSTEAPTATPTDTPTDTSTKTPTDFPRKRPRTSTDRSTETPMARSPAMPADTGCLTLLCFSKL